jgi:putative Holliday junction resolvase
MVDAERTHNFSLNSEDSRLKYDAPAISGRVLALDVGKKRIGLAISDPLGLTAQGLDTLHRTRIREDLASLSALALEREVGGFLVGLPLHMSGDESRQAQYTREFGERLQASTNLPVVYWDERWTSVEAGRVLRSSGISIEKRAQAVDKLSAVLLLESFLDYRRFHFSEDPFPE